VIFAGSGNDDGAWRSGDDLIFAGAGNAILEGGGGNDVLETSSSGRQQACRAEREATH